MKLSQIQTPAAVLDLGRLRGNCAAMLARTRARWVGLRPHMKTLKSADAARLALDPGHGGIAVSTLKEGEYFADHGFSDIQCAVCLTPDKLERAAALLARAPGFSFFIDSAQMAEAVVARARTSGASFRVWIEVDGGEHRTGAAPNGPDLLEIAGRLADPAVVLAGVATHAGQAYAADSLDQIRAVAEAERRAVTLAAERIRRDGAGGRRGQRGLDAHGPARRLRRGPDRAASGGLYGGRPLSGGPAVA